MVLMYGICVIISIFLYLWLYLTDVKHSVCQNAMVMIMTISNLGYLALSLSTHINEALLSYKIAYLGGFFLPLLYFFTVCEICDVELPQVFRTVLIIGQILCYAVVCFAGFNTWYYKEVQLVIADGYAYIDKVYGSLHFLYPLTMYGYFAASLTIAIYSAIKKKTVNNKELVKMLFFAAIAVSFYIVQRYIGKGVQLMAAADIILMVGAIIPIYHSNMFTADKNQEIIDEQIEDIGFITFNRRLEYMSCNDYAVYIFKELEDFDVGQRIFPKDEGLKKLCYSFKEYVALLEDDDVKGHRDTKLITIKRDDKYYESEVHTIEDFFGKRVGYTIILNDETEHYTIIEMNEKESEKLERKVKEKTRKIRSIQERTILGMAQMVESRDLSTGGHIKRTSDVVDIFSKRLMIEDMTLDNDFLELVIRSAPMHDLGKIGVDDAILRKQAKFTDEEYAIMKKHSEIGGKMVEDILTGVEEDDFVSVAKNVAHYHHEKVDGTGYPEGLKGEEIPVEARIMALADVFDALVSKRCYKEAFSYDKAFSIIENDAGSHFDAKLAKIFLSCRKELENYYDNCEH